jgi:UDP-N-acetyl-D-mannosaminuronate dehydrogenase
MLKYQEVHYFKEYSLTEKERVRLIENLYRLININFDDFIKNN